MSYHLATHGLYQVTAPQNYFPVQRNLTKPVPLSLSLILLKVPKKLNVWGLFCAIICFHVLFRQDLDEEFQKKRDFVEQYTTLTKETFVVRDTSNNLFLLSW